ncbi:MAG: hypothetical protein AAGA65_31130, partial [Actinomycetota bacterium]
MNTRIANRHQRNPDRLPRRLRLVRPDPVGEAPPADGPEPPPADPSDEGVEVGDGPVGCGSAKELPPGSGAQLADGRSGADSGSGGCADSGS